MMKQISFLYLSWLFLQLLAWHIEPLFSLMAFVPFLFFLESKHVYKKIITYFFILSWHFVVIFWLLQMDWLKGLEAIAFNSLITFLPIYFYLLLYQKFSHDFRPIIFIIFWLLMEYLQHHWFMGFPWLLLGNAFGASPACVQWYKFTGVLGGSLWILACNFAFKSLIEYIFSSKSQDKFKVHFLFWKRTFKIGTSLLLLLAIPLGYSWYLYEQTNSSKQDTEIIFLQSNLEHYESDSKKVALLQEAIKPILSAKTDYLLLPETFFAAPLWESQIKETVLYLRLKNLLHLYPKLKIIFGANLKTKTTKASKYQEIGIYYELRNVAIQLDSSENLKIKQKAVFVPVEEYVPEFLQFLPFKSDFLSLPTTHQHSFKNKKESVFVGICYEMVNSFFVKEHLQKTDKVMLMLSSEAFFEGATTGMKQYINICRLRAIENQIPLIKSSSKGFAAWINEKGELITIEKKLNAQKSALIAHVATF